MNRRQIPNSLTVLRLVLAAVFFALLEIYRYPGGASALLMAAVAVFIAAAATDALDGYLARRWSAESVFGRIMDPFCDKILILGAVLYLASPAFLDVESGRMVSGVYPWMVVLVLARELLVTGIRGIAEQRGINFGAKAIGKWKMILQSVVVPVVLLIVAVDPTRGGWTWLVWPRDVLVYATVLVTLVSGWPYLRGAAALMREG